MVGDKRKGSYPKPGHLSGLKGKEATLNKTPTQTNSQSPLQWVFGLIQFDLWFVRVYLKYLLNQSC